MMRLTPLLLLLFLFISVAVQAQYRDHVSYNRLGLQAGITYGGINTDNFKTTNKVSFTAGFGTRANVYNNLIIIYGVNFYQFVTGVLMKEDLSSPAEEIDFKDIGVQINLFVGQKLIGEHLGIELGPVLQINSKWMPDEAYENYYVEGYKLQAKDIKNISRVNLNLAANLSGGFKDFKIWFQYQYGVNNMFSRLNTSKLSEIDPTATQLNGHLGLATIGMIFYL